jgi:predicted metal-dependent hydrolase
VSDCLGSLHPEAVHGMQLFNSGQYFEAHEALEAAWREETGPVRDLYRGILQVGVVYLHIRRRNFPGAVKVYHRCRKWLDLWPDTCRGVDVAHLKKDLENVIQVVLDLGPDHISEFNDTLLKPVHYYVGENR